MKLLLVLLHTLISNVEVSYIWPLMVAILDFQNGYLKFYVLSFMDLWFTEKFDPRVLGYIFNYKKCNSIVFIMKNVKLKSLLPCRDLDL